MTPRIVFIGRETHLKTKSDAFFIDMLREIGDVTILRRESLSNAECLRQIRNANPTLVIFYQLPPSFWHHLVPLRGIRLIWVPMWDGFKELSWKRHLAYRFFGVEAISFCQKLHHYFESIQLPSISVQYFPAPSFLPVRGSPPYTLFLWQRDQTIGLEFVHALFPAGHIDKVIFKSDFPGTVSSHPTLQVERLNGWIPSELLFQKMGEADYYLAPRRQEGIGFSFLEAMARGRIVVGFDDATMNEYIQDDVTGHLFDNTGRLSDTWKSPAELYPQIKSYGQQAFNLWQQQRTQLKTYLTE